MPPGTYDEHHAFRDYTGMLYVRQLPRLHSLSCVQLDTHSYLFKRERRRVQVEKLHLPPGTPR